jgi:hypothetical protein
VFSGLDSLVGDIHGITDDKPVTDLMHPLTIDMDATCKSSRMMIENRHHRLLVIDPTNQNAPRDRFFI